MRVERDPHIGLGAVVAAADRAEALRHALDRCAFKSEVFAARNSDAPYAGRPSSPIYPGRTLKSLERVEGTQLSFTAVCHW